MAVVTPVMTMAPAPVAVMPAAAPVPVPAVVPMAVMMPAHFLRLDMINLVLRYDSRLNACARARRQGWLGDRRQGCGLCACGEHRAARNESNGEFQKIPAFHHIRPFSGESRKAVSSFQDECSLNSAMLSVCVSPRTPNKVQRHLSDL